MHADYDPASEKLTRLEIGSVELSLVSPRSLDELLDAARDDDALPFWAHVWDSGFGLVRFLVEQWLPTAHRRPGASGRPLRVLELGCGIGTVGCAAAQLGCSVVMTDFQPIALAYAARNLHRNSLEASLVLADWRQFPVQAPFDLVIGSDILYESRVHGALLAILDDQRSRGAAVLLADPGRPGALAFAAARERDGWPIRLELSAGPPDAAAETAIAVYATP